MTFIFAGQTFIVCMVLFYQFLGWGSRSRPSLVTIPAALVVAGIVWNVKSR